MGAIVHLSEHLFRRHSRANHPSPLPPVQEPRRAWDVDMVVLARNRETPQAPARAATVRLSVRESGEFCLHVRDGEDAEDRHYRSCTKLEPHYRFVWGEILHFMLHARKG